MRHPILVLIIVLIAAVACKQTEKPTEENETSHTAHDGHDHKTLEEISLNNGEKWEMQEELMQNVSNMEMAIKAENAKDSIDYGALTEIIDNETRQMISTCTMKGQSHIELHKWLEPHLAMIKDLKASTDPVQSKAIIAEIDASYVLLRQYFE